MAGIHFRFSPNILVRLGEELNQGTDQSILELIKNSYDADATSCTVELKDTTRPGGEIVVTDDGSGMRAEDIKNSWLVLGKSSKSHLQTTTLGRTPSGSKGLGRLAALRMGRVVRLESKQIGAEKSNVLKVEWDRFDSAQTVEDVELSIVEESTEIKKGTVTRLSNLRSAIRSDELKKLARAVLLLTDPFEDRKSGFKVTLKAPEFDEIEKLLSQKYFDYSAFHLVSTLDEDGKASAKILDWNDKVLHQGDHLEIKGSDEAFKAPVCTFDFWAFLLKSEGFASGQGVSLSDIRVWLKNFGGVHIYQDNVRVSPYGSPGDDWLEVNLNRTRNPEERPSTNNSIGKLSLSNKGEYQLTQKTDRSGFIEDEPFLQLKEFAHESLEWMARWRLQQAEKRRGNERKQAPEAAKVEKMKFEEVLQIAPKQLRDKLSVAFDQYAKSRDKESDVLRKEIQLYRTLSTAGITAATFAHESHGNPLKVIGLAVNVIDSRVGSVSSGGGADFVSKAISKIRAALDALSVLGVATLSLVRANKRRVGRVDINLVLRQVNNMMLPFLEARATKVELNLSGGQPYLRCSEAAVESIATNLINNSINAFRRGHTEDRLIKITTEIVADVCVLTISDSGPGISYRNVSEIWLPGVTSNPDGTGLGLTIVRDTVKDLGGTVEAIANGELGGAEFKISLPIIGV